MQSRGELVVARTDARWGGRTRSGGCFDGARARRRERGDAIRSMGDV